MDIKKLIEAERWRYNGNVIRYSSGSIGETVREFSAQNIVTCHNNILDRILAALEEGTQPAHQVSSTYGDLVQKYPALTGCFEPHIWDNMTITEQRDWALNMTASFKNSAPHSSQTIPAPSSPEPQSGEDALVELREWKRQQIQVESEWDAQAVGRELNLPLGSSIRAGILPAIIRLKQEFAAARPEIERERDENRVDRLIASRLSAQEAAK